MWYQYIKPYRFQAIIGFIFKLMEAFLELLVPLFVADIIDYGISFNNQTYIWYKGGLLFLLAFVGYGCALICQYFASYTSQSFGTDLRQDLYRKINTYDFNLLDRIGTSTIINRLSNDINQLQVAIAMTIRLVSRSPFLIIGSLIMAYRIDTKMSVIFFICTPLLALSIYIIMHLSLPIYSKIQKQLDHVALICRENLNGIRVIRAFSKQSQEFQRFKQATTKQKQMQYQVGHLSALLNPTTTIIVNLAIITLLYAGGIKVNIGTLSQGQVIALINYMNQILLSMYVFADVLVILNKARASYQRIQELFSYTPTINDGKITKYDESQPFISFNDVSFSYQNVHVLSHISFTIQHNETIGIIGGTGAGKSTLVSLIPRFYDPTSGSVFLYNINIKNYQLEIIRQQIGYVFQEPELISGTIEQLLQMGKNDATKEEMIEALQIAQAHFVFEHPDGLQRILSQGGLNLSGGQRQRLAIARVLIKKPKLLILDDCMSALDYATEKQLRQSLQTLNCSQIIVSQRVASIQHANRILVLSHGELVGIGTHDQLLEDCDIYKEIVQSQSMEEQP